VLVVIGGGQAGSYHARQLLKAVRSGRLPRQRLLVVDRNPACSASSELAGWDDVELVKAEWSEFLSAWLPGASFDDHVIPAPWAPHLLSDWLSGELAAEPAEPPRGWRLPYEVAAGGTLYLSAAAWTCPATCVEPAHCPALHAPRDWDLGDLIETEALARGYRPAIFRCTQLAGGVGSIGVAQILQARDGLRQLPQPPRQGNVGPLPYERVLIGTSSRCHAAVNAIRIFTFTA
jgi:hypothetical protein